MPRFSMKWLLIAFAVVALWLATFRLPLEGQSIRGTISMVAFISVLLAVIYCRGRQRAFWMGFLFVMAAITIGEPREWVPQFGWLAARFANPNISLERYDAFNATAQALAVIIIAPAVGYIATRIYDSANKSQPN